VLRPTDHGNDANWGPCCGQIADTGIFTFILRQRKDANEHFFVLKKSYAALWKARQQPQARNAICRL